MKVWCCASCFAWRGEGQALRWALVFFFFEADWTGQGTTQVIYCSDSLEKNFLKEIRFANHTAFYPSRSTMNNAPPFSCKARLGSAATPSQLSLENTRGQPLHINPPLQITSWLRNGALSSAKAHVCKNSPKFVRDGQYKQGVASCDISLASLLHPTVKKAHSGIKPVKEPHGEILNVKEKDGGYEA